MTCITGFIGAVPAGNRDAFIRHAELSAAGFHIPVLHSARDDFNSFAALCDPIFVEHGAAWVMEAWELDVPDGKLTDFRHAVAARTGEAIVFSWVQWPDRTTRDAANAQIMTDPRFAAQDC